MNGGSVVDLTSVNGFYLSQGYTACSPHVNFSLGTGFSGGIWVFWDNRTIQLQPLDKMNQQLTFLATPKNGKNPSFFLSAKYTSLDKGLRHQLWDSLSLFGHTHVTNQDAWMPMGDFNYILGNHKKIEGTRNLGPASFKAFQDFIDSNSLVDMGFHGSPFT